MRPRPHSPIAVARLLLAVSGVVAVAACGARPVAPPSGPVVREGLASVVGMAAMAVPAPAPFRGPAATPDLLVYAPQTLPPRLLSRLAEAPGVSRALRVSVGNLPFGGRTVHLVAGDPARLRGFTAPTVAAADDVWRRVAGGEAVVAPALRVAVDSGQGYLRLAPQATTGSVHVGAVASLPSPFDIVVNQRWGEALGLPADNAVLVSVAQRADIGTTTRSLQRLVGKRAAIRSLAAVSRPSGPQTGYLTGGAVAAAVGSFTYLPRPDGTVVVDSAWVSANIRTEDVPILGRVSCHRAMLPQLRGALQEVVDRGLGSRIRPGEYGGCFYPRYIGYDPAKGLSLHSWGIAIDLNVPGNLRGTVGEIDRDVVAIFKRWGFGWGGDWAWTDPMHFELAALVVPR